MNSHCCLSQKHILDMKLEPSTWLKLVNAWNTTSTTMSLPMIYKCKLVDIRMSTCFRWVRIDGLSRGLTPVEIMADYVLSCHHLQNVPASLLPRRIYRVCRPRQCSHHEVVPHHRTLYLSPLLQGNGWFLPDPGKIDSLNR